MLCGSDAIPHGVWFSGRGKIRRLENVNGKQDPGVSGGISSDFIGLGSTGLALLAAVGRVCRNQPNPVRFYEILPRRVFSAQGRAKLKSSERICGSRDNGSFQELLDG